jgi:Ni,Fe-hydrogenase maturation factor
MVRSHTGYNRANGLRQVSGSSSGQSTSKKSTSAALVSLGNTLRGDDGIGVVLCDLVKARLEAKALSLKHIELGGYTSLLAETIRNYDLLIIVDACRSAGRLDKVSIGSSYFFSLSDLLWSKTIDLKSTELESTGMKTTEANVQNFLGGTLITSHGLSIMDELLALDPSELEHKQIYLFAIEVGDTCFGHSLSTEMENQLDRLTNELFEQTVRLIQVEK